MKNLDKDLKIGQVVKSKAGRDKGDWMVIINILNNDLVEVCNGVNRKVSNPKKKKVKHLSKTNYISDLIIEKIAKELKISNADIRSTLEPFIEKEIKAQLKEDLDSQEDI